MAKARTQNVTENANSINWKRRPSEIRGYLRAMYFTAENGDYIRVDYNVKDQRVRLFVEIASDGGNAYYSVIKDGKIAAERSVASGRSFGFADKFSERAEIFSSIPNKDVVRLINGNYGIVEDFERKKRNEERARRLEETKRRYFRKEDDAGNPYTASQKKAKAQAAVAIGVSDFLDVLAGAVLSLAVFYYMQYSFIAMGIMSAFYGLSIGLFDIMIRNRPPVFVKMIIFILAGFISYLYGYYLM